MRQDPRRNVTGTTLPPPPAPPSRDANPWHMSAGRPAARLPGLRVPPEKVPERLKTVPKDAAPAPPSSLRWVPFAMLGAVLLAVGADALRAFLRGDYLAALVPLVFVAFVAVAILRSRQRRAD